VALAKILDGLERCEGENLYSALADAQPRSLPAACDIHVTEALSSLAPEVLALIGERQTRADPSTRTDVEMVESERSDRLVTALRLAGIPPARAQPVDQDRQAIPAELRRFDRKLREKDMISQDAALFPDWEHGRNIGGWYEFRRTGRQVFVKNIDFTKDEADMGGDLVYLRRQPDAAIIVQYKRLREPAGKRTGWTFHDDKRLRRQLDRMLDVDRRLAPRTLQLGGATDYRLNDSVGFVKFVDSRPVAPDGLSPLEGCYLPAEYARALLHDLAETGQGALPPFNPRDHRTIDSQTFVRLVSEGWIGSYAGGTKALSEQLLPMLRDERSGEVTCVFDQPMAQGVELGVVGG
jgi:hypothetical protein